MFLVSCMVYKFALKKNKNTHILCRLDCYICKWISLKLVSMGWLEDVLSLKLVEQYCFWMCKFKIMKYFLDH